MKFLGKINFKFIFSLLFLICFSLLLLVQGPCRISYTPPLSLVIPSDLLIEDSWYGIYFQGSYVGYSHFFMRTKTLKEGGGYFMRNVTNVTLPVLGTVQKLALEVSLSLLSNYCLEEAHFKIRSHRYFLRGYLKKEKGNLYKLSINTPSQNFQKKILLKNEIVASLVVPITLNYFPLNKYTTLYFYDPFLERKEELTLVRKGKVTIALDGEEKEAHLIYIHFGDARGKVYIDNQGKLLKEEFLGFEFVKKEPSVLFKEKPVLTMGNLANYLAVKATPLPNKENLVYLKLKLEGVSKEFIREDFNQRVEFKDGYFIVQVYKKEPQRIENLPLQGEFNSYLKEDRYIKFKTHKIEELVSSIIKGENNPLVILEKFLFWINTHIKKVPTLSLPNTLDVLEIKEGDCGELSALLVGFLRSVGIPSYVNIGLVYNKGKFFYHAWPSVFVGEWIDTDPAFNQLIADPTHIKLLKGLESQFQISKIIGNVKIEILEYK